jgi:VCBS repeat-containing protein
VAKNFVRLIVVAVLAAFSVYAADDVASAVHGTVTKIDSTTKTMVVKTKDGTEETVHYTDKTAVWGADKTAAGAKDTVKGVEVGSEVVVKYTGKGADKSATAVEKVGKDGLKAMDGTVEKVGKDGKTVVVKSADGTEHTFEVAGKGTAEGATKAGKTTVYYTEEGGKKVAHFFEKL